MPPSKLINWGQHQLQNEQNLEGGYLSKIGADGGKMGRS
jgi:hypothetical protein